MEREARYATRKPQLLEGCQVTPEICDQVLPRLATLLAPFVASFWRPGPDPQAPDGMGEPYPQSGDGIDHRREPQ